LAYSTYLAATYASYITGVAVDSAGEAYVTGYQVSLSFPTTAGAFQSSSVISPGTGAWYAFFTKFDAAGATLVYSTVFGSATPPGGGEGDPIPPQNSTYGYGIAVDTDGDAYITGYTQDGNLPTTAGAFQTSAAPLFGSYNEYMIEGSRGFVAKFNPAQSGNASLIYATYLGGTTDGSADQATGIAVDSKFNAYITGNAESPNFPTTKGAFQTTCLIDQTYCTTAFITKLNPAGSALVYSTFLGPDAAGGADVTSARIRVNASGDAFVTGTAGNGFPLMNPITTVVGSSFATELNSTGRALLFSTYLEGSSVSPASLAVDGEGSIYITGESNGLTVTPGAFQQTEGGGDDAFVMKIATVANDLQLTNAAPTSVATGADLTYTITALNNGPDAASSVTISDAVTTGSTFVSVSTTSGSCTSPAVGATGTVKCSIGDVVDGGTAIVTLTVKVTAAAGKVVKDTASIAAAGFDSAPSKTATAETKVIR
jgi:uncharacterized repeat protein (TIGR01451 family)